MNDLNNISPSNQKQSSEGLNPHSPRQIPQINQSQRTSEISSESEVTDLNQNSSQSSFQPDQYEYASQISLMKSEASVESNTYNISPTRLFSLQIQVTHQILCLRQEKITLMEELSRKIDVRNEIQEAIHLDQEQKRISSNAHTPKSSKEAGNIKNDQSRSVESIVTDEKEITSEQIAQATKEKERLVAKLAELKQLKVQTEEANQIAKSVKQAQLANEIKQIQLKNAQLEEELHSLESHDQQGSRFATFLPQDKAKHQGVKALMVEHQQLVEKYQFLLAEESAGITNSSERQYLYDLQMENQNLTREARQLTAQKEQPPHSLLLLRQRVQSMEAEKQTFLEDLVRFRQSMKQVALENQQLKQNRPY